ncbi:hypothetical protein ACKS0A_02374 [Histoplasma ohiense]
MSLDNAGLVALLFPGLSDQNHCCPRPLCSQTEAALRQRHFLVLSVHGTVPVSQIPGPGNRYLLQQHM